MTTKKKIFIGAFILIVISFLVYLGVKRKKIPAPKLMTDPNITAAQQVDALLSSVGLPSGTSLSNVPPSSSGNTASVDALLSSANLPPGTNITITNPTNPTGALTQSYTGSTPDAGKAIYTVTPVTSATRDAVIIQNNDLLLNGDLEYIPQVLEDQSATYGITPRG